MFANGSCEAILFAIFAPVVGAAQAASYAVTFCADAVRPVITALVGG